MSLSQINRQVFQKYVPSAAVEYCLELFNRYGFRFKVTRSRKTKLGDYRFLMVEKKHLITINHDLNRFQFLVTYLHEVAHLITYEGYQGSVRPHGQEWKNNFRNLLEPLNQTAVFPQDIVAAIDHYLKNPRASNCADPGLYRALNRYDARVNGDKLLADLQPGDIFLYNKRTFQKENKKRTRSICLDIHNGKRYLISELALVSPQMPTLA